MSEQPSSTPAESIPEQVQGYLTFATGELLKAGAGTCLKHNLDQANQWAKDMSEESENDLDLLEWQRSMAEEFYKAELPLFITKDESADFPELGTHFGVLKVDGRGHAFLGCGNTLFILNPDGSQKMNDPSAPWKVDQSLIDTVQMLAKKQEELGWQPVVSLDDVPSSRAA